MQPQMRLHAGHAGSVTGCHTPHKPLLAWGNMHEKHAWLCCSARLAWRPGNACCWGPQHVEAYLERVPDPTRTFSSKRASTPSSPP